MAAQYILAALAIVFLVMGIGRSARAGGTRHPEGKTWLLIGVIFAAVSAWLFSQG